MTAAGRLASRTLASLLTGAVTLLPAPGRGPWAATTRWSEPSPARAALEIDATELGEDGPALGRRLREKGEAVLREAEILPGGPEDPALRVSVRRFAGENPGYAFDVSVWADGAPIADTQHTETCELCTEGELVDQVERSIVAVVPVLVETAKHDPAPEPTPGPPPRPSRPPPLGTLGKAGVGTLAFGVAGVAVGLGLGLAPETSRTDPDSGHVVIDSTHVPGWIVLGLGAAATVVGAALLGVDRSRARRAKITPTAVGGRGFVGVAIAGWF